MNRIAHIDLAGMRVDSESFLGQAIALGVRYRKLPDGYPEGLRFFLQAAGTTYARRYRTGIAVNTAALAEGVRQAAISLELGLSEAASGDLDEAVRCLAEGDLETMRRRGYEVAWERLTEMKAGSDRVLDRSELSLLGPAWKDLKRWAKITPETWQVPATDDPDESPAVDPIQDFGSYERISGRLGFLASLPAPAVKALQASGGDVLFEDVLRRIGPSLALDRERLGEERSDESEFRETCCDDGGLKREIQDRVARMLDQFLGASVATDWVRDEIREEFLNELTDLASLGDNGPEDGLTQEEESGAAETA